MTAEIPKPAEIHKTKGYLLRRILSKWPFLVWVGMAALTYLLYQRGVRFERMNGIVVAETEIIAALEDGSIAGLTVAESGDAVDAGQLVVQIDDRQVIGLLKQREQELQFERIEQSRKYGSLKTGYIAEIARIEAQRDGDVARLAVLDESLVDLKDRADKNLIRMSQYTEAKTEAETLRASLPSRESEITGLKEALTNVETLLTRLEEFNKTEPVELALLQDQIERMKLHSLNGGTVSSIYFKQGSVVKRGEPIIEIINLKSRGAKGFIPEEDADKVSVGLPIFISPTGEATATIYPGKITYISPQISSTPDTGGSVAGRMIKGREITCSFDSPDAALLPGQSVTIHLERPGKFKLFSKD